MDEIRFELDCDASIPHFHDELEILFVLSGRLNVRKISLYLIYLNIMRYTGRQEDIRFLPLYTNHLCIRQK